MTKPRTLVAGGLTAALMGAAAIVPIVTVYLERGQLTGLAIGFAAAAVVLILGGLIAAAAGGRRRATAMPSPVRAVVAANALVLAFLSLELCDRSIRQDGKLFYWTTFLLPPALLLFIGLLAARSWSWWAARILAILGVFWFLGFLLLIPFAPLSADGIATPWYGRLYMAAVTLAFAAIAYAAFRALGRKETRTYFQPDPTD